MLTRYVAFAVYMVVVAVVGLVAARKVKSLSDFVAASGRLGFWTYVLLMVGSVFSGMTCIGVAGLSYLTGYANLWERVLGPPLAIALATMLYAPKLVKVSRRTGILTLQDYLALRYYDERFIRGLSGAVSALVCAIYLIGQYVAIGIVSKVVFGWEYWQGCLLAAMVVILYVVAGGMFSVAWTTLIQSALMIGGTMLLAPYIVSRLGGFTALNLKASMVSQGPFHQYLTEPWGPPQLPLIGPLFNLTLFGIAVTLGLTVAPHIVNNIVTVKRTSCIKWGPLACYVLGVIVILGTSLMGLAARVAESEGLIELMPHPLGGKWFDMALPTLAEALLPEALFSLFLIMVLAAVMSTTDRLMLTIGVNIGYDVYKNLLKPQASERSVSLVAKLTVLAVGIATFIIALSPPPLVAWLIWLALSLMCNTWLVPLICGLYWRRATKAGCIASMLTGLSVTIIAGYLSGKPPVGLGWTLKLFDMPYYFVLLGFIASWIAMVTVSLATSKPAKQLLDDTLTGLFL